MDTNEDNVKKRRAEEISDNLKRVFQDYGNETVPENLKNEVFKTLDTLELIGSIADLFTVKFSMTESELFAALNQEEEKLGSNDF